MKLHKNKNLRNLHKKWQSCTKCSLHKNIVNYVFFRGSCPCDVLFVGEAPGKDENAVGEPFIGRSGDLLESLVEAVREDLEKPFSYGVTNTICCIPINYDRTSPDYGSLFPPRKEHTQACSHKLVKTASVCSPSLVVCVGKVAETTVQEYLLPLNYNICGIPHPSFILRNGGQDSLSYKRTKLILTEQVERYA